MEMVQKLMMSLVVAAPLALAGWQGDEEEWQSDEATSEADVADDEPTGEAASAQTYCPSGSTWYPAFGRCLVEPVRLAPPNVCPHGGVISGWGISYCYAGPLGFGR
ncbi:hypothetical protein [Sorangium sp. So ce233]|uniref:hypothetical protein n=1 Tax=Sorangium sp. So ce233 TaxID=3133290 RepID=UPI003F63AA4C